MDLKVLLVDDEPGALRFLEQTIAARCPGWEVTGCAENGRQALAKMEGCPPDFVLTDIRMPVMDGIELARRIREDWPTVRVAIISGHEDFAAAQSAIRYGVSDYLLKPVNPAQLVEMMEQARGEVAEQKRLDAVRLFTAAAGGRPLEGAQLARIFPCEQFQAALVRAGPLPSRFSGRLAAGLEGEPTGLQEHCWLIAGRDEQEMFVFQATPGHGLPLEDTARYAARLLGGTAGDDSAGAPESSFFTIAYHREAFPLTRLGEVTAALQRTVHRSLVLGATRSVDDTDPPERTDVAVDGALEQQVTGLCQGVGQTRELRELVQGLYEAWQAQQRPLYLVEQDTLRLLTAARRGVANAPGPPADTVQQLDEAVFRSADYTELGERVWNILLGMLSQAERQDAPPGSDAFFEAVQAHIEQNLAGMLSMQTLCAAMGISQTYMSRIFRKQAGMPFSEYLTARRMERAKQIMAQQPQLPLKTIAELCGYRDPLYFSKVFRATQGVPPSRYSEADFEEA